MDFMQDKLPQKALQLSFDKEQDPSELSIYVIGEINKDTITSEDLAALMENITVQSLEKVRLFINTPGGSLGITAAIISALNMYKSMDRLFTDKEGNIYEIKRKVEANGLGLVASAGSWLLLQGDTRIINPFTSCMIHSIASACDGPVNEMESYIKHIKNQNDDSLDIIFSEYLTAKEKKKYKDGPEIWLNSLDLCKRGMVDFLQHEKHLIQVDSEVAKQCKTIKEFIDVSLGED